MAASRRDHDDQDRRVKGTEVFVGGLPQSATEGKLREVFSTCGEIVGVRIMKDQNGKSKGYGFVRFSKREYANTAKRKKLQLQGKKLDVDLSSDQDTLFFGNLKKEWSSKDFEELIHKTFKDVISVDLAMASNSSNKRHLNRGFAFVRFSSHGAAARVIRIGSRADFLLGGIVHPSINWAEKETHLNTNEMDKDRGPPFKIQVSDIRPAADNNRKRTREEENIRRRNIPRERPDYSYGRREHGSHDRQGKAPRLSNTVVDKNDPYDSAIISLPPAAKELLLRILRLRIGTRYDIDINCIKDLNELPESSAVAVLNQFLISGGDKQNKGDYFASLIAKHQAPSYGLVHTLHGTYLPRNPEIHSKRFSHDDYDYVTSGTSRYRSSGHYSSDYADDPPMPEPRIRGYAEERLTLEPRMRQEEMVDIRRYPEAAFGHESRHNTGRIHDRRYTHEQISKIERSPEESILSRERRYGAEYSTDIGPEFFSRSSAEYSAARQQVRFDPFTGEPYKFDPFTGEPIRPERNERRSGSLY